MFVMCYKYFLRYVFDIISTLSFLPAHLYMTEFLEVEKKIENTPFVQNKIILTESC